MPALDLAALPSRLNLGCGFDLKDGYLNVDFQEMHQPDLVADVRELGMLPDAHFDEVLAQDVLEHLERTDTVSTLREWRRVLRPGGLLRLQMPDVTAVGRILWESDSAELHELFLHHLYGTQAYSGDYHQAGFTDVFLVERLVEAGFDDITLDTMDGWLLVAEAHRAAEDPAARRPLTVGFTRGLYPWEGDGAERFRWCGAEAAVLVANAAGQPRRARLTMTLGGNLGPQAIPIDVALDDRAERVHVGATPQCWSAEVVLAPGPHRVRLRSGGGPVDAPGDARSMYFRLHDLAVTVLD